MTEAQYQFGRVASIKANAVGEPGSRRFRLLIEAGNGAKAVVWMQKEQLFNLAMALKNLLAQVEEAREQRRLRLGRQAETGATVDSSQQLEFQVGRMSVGYDEASALFLIAANEIEEPENATPRLSLVADQQSINALADEAFEVCSAGRPLCPLCGAPMNPNENHVCPRHNGHSVLGETREL